MSRRLAELTEGLIEAVGLKPRSTSDRARRIREAAKEVAANRLHVFDAVERVGYLSCRLSDTAATLRKGFRRILDLANEEAGR